MELVFVDLKKVEILNTKNNLCIQKTSLFQVRTSCKIFFTQVFFETGNKPETYAAEFTQARK